MAPRQKMSVADFRKDLDKTKAEPPKAFEPELAPPVKHATPKIKKPEPEKVVMQTTAVNLPREMLNTLRLVAANRANRHGGRASVSKLIADVMTERLPELEKELMKH